MGPFCFRFFLSQGKCVVEKEKQLGTKKCAKKVLGDKRKKIERNFSFFNWNEKILLSNQYNYSIATKHSTRRN